MTTITKKSLRVLIIRALSFDGLRIKLRFSVVGPILFATLTTLSMETNYPQLQLENPNKQKDLLLVDCSIMLADGITTYAMQAVHTAIFEHSNIQSTIKDPIMLFQIQKKSTSNQFYLPLPVKLFVNCTEGSILHIHETDASQLYKSHPIFKKKHLLITAICTKNPKLAGNNFAEQFINTMNTFYANPGEPWINEEYQGELEAAGIMIVKQILISTAIQGRYGPALGLMPMLTFEHGPNGCPNEKALMQLIINGIIPYSAKASKGTPKNKRLFKALMRRQINGSFPKK